MKFPWKWLFPWNRKRGKAKAQASVKDTMGTTTRVMGFRRMFPDGIMQLDDTHWSMAVSFDDVNYQSLRRDEQIDILDAYGEFLNSLDDTVSTQVWLASTRIERRELSQRIALHDVEGDEGGNELRHEINALLSSKLTANDRSMRKDRQLVFTVEAPTREKAAKKLMGAYSRAHGLFTGLDGREQVLEWSARANSVNRMCNQDMAHDAITRVDDGAWPGLTLADVLSPSKIERPNASDLLVGDRYVRSYVVVKFGSTVRDDLLSALSQLSGDVVVSMHFTAWKQEKARGFAESHLDDVKLEISSYKNDNTDPLRGRYVDDESLPEHMKDALAEAIKARDALVSQDQRMFETTLVVTAMGRTPEELALVCDEVEAVFGEQRLNGKWIREWREALFTSSLPIGRCCVPFRRNFFTDPLSCMVPFTSVEVMDEGGLYLGTNFETNNFILYDRERDEDSNGFILGEPGGGKSVQSKWTIAQTLLTDPTADVFVIDPEREYVKMCEEFDGQHIVISEGSADHVNLFDISRYYGSEGEDQAMSSPLPLKVNMIQAALHMMAKSITDEERNVIDSVCSYIYQPYLESLDPRDMPTLQTFYDALLKVQGATAEDARHLATIIARYVTGTVNVFNHGTNVDLKKRFVVFDIRDLGSTLKPLALLIILDHIWNRVTANRAAGRKTYLFIDELQLLLDDEFALDFFDEVWTRSRKWGLYVTGITQNISRLLSIKKTRYMVENTHFLTLCRQSAQSAALLAETLRLSDSQARTLRTAAKGEGLYIFGRRVIHYNNVIPPEMCPRLYAALTTKFSDLHGNDGTGVRRMVA
jgi:hypothetical protein